MMMMMMMMMAMVRSHLGYASSLLIPVAKSHLDKLDIVQRKAARIICQVPSDSHAAPLLEELNLQSLESRRNQHLVKIVTSCIEKKCHPDFINKFSKSLSSVNELSMPPSRTLLGRKRFSFIGAAEYNKSINSNSNSSQTHVKGSASSRQAPQVTTAHNVNPFSLTHTASPQLNQKSSIEIST